VNWDPVDHTVLANEQVIEREGLAVRRAGGAARAPIPPKWYLKSLFSNDHRLFRDLLPHSTDLARGRKKCG